jgi:hypothetical protein
MLGLEMLLILMIYNQKLNVQIVDYVIEKPVCVHAFLVMMELLVKEAFVRMTVTATEYV